MTQNTFYINPLPTQSRVASPNASIIQSVIAKSHYGIPERSVIGDNFRDDRSVALTHRTQIQSVRSPTQSVARTIIRPPSNGLFYFLI